MRMIKKLMWKSRVRINSIFFIAKRYFKTKRESSSLAPAVLSVFGILIGVMVLTSVISIMNGFQFGMIENILEIRSYHLRILPERSGFLEKNEIEDIRNCRGVKAVLPFMDIQTIVKSSYSDFIICLLRAVEKNVQAIDPGLIKQLNIISGKFDLSKKNSIVIGNLMASCLGVDVGDSVRISSIVGNSFNTIKQKQSSFRVTGIFKSWERNIDLNTAFISFSDSKSITQENEKMIYGVKLKNHFDDTFQKHEVSKLLKSKAKIISWREYNRSFFGVLRLEKLMMMFLIGLIFIVVGVNIFHSLQKTVYERIEEIGILRSTGASLKAIQLVFIIEGLYIGLIGSVSGLILGFFISGHINEIFAVFNVFPTTYFYMDKIPARIGFFEILFIFLFSVLSSVLAAFSASSEINRINPAEVLRYE